MNAISAVFASLSNPINALLAALAVLTGTYVVGWSKSENGPTLVEVLIGAVTNFLDALGIGSFATSTAAFRALKLVPDRIIPGTLNVGHTLPTVAQAFIFTAVIPVDVVTLFSMIAAAVAGAYLGAGIVAGWPKRKVQLGMGFALLAAATFFAMRNMGWFPAGSDAIGVRGMTLVLAVIGNFFLGALMSLGIGLYAPCMILVSLLGMSERTAFPIMMGSCAFLMPVASGNFIKLRSYDPRASMGLLLGGIPGVLISAYIVKSMNVDWLKWLVVVVVTYTSMSMLLTARRERLKAGAAPAAAH